MKFLFAYILFTASMALALHRETQHDDVMTEHYDHHEEQHNWKGFYQGDIKLEEQDDGNFDQSIRRLNSNKLQKWDDNLQGGYFKVLVYIDPNDYTANQAELIEEAIKNLKYTAKVIKFDFLSWKPGNNNSRPYLHIQKAGGCWSYYGRMSTAHQGQTLSLGNECLARRNIQHVILHALGFAHEVNRSDRDDFISINYNNILDSCQDEFAIMDDVNSLGVPFDYKSAMLYKPRTCSKNGQATLSSTTGNQIDTSRTEASWFDYIQLRLMYQCVGSNNRSFSRTYDQYRNQKCSTQCQCWKDAGGCKGRDDFCKGDLVCQGDWCKNPWD